MRYRVLRATLLFITLELSTKPSVATDACFVPCASQRPTPNANYEEAARKGGRLQMSKANTREFDRRNLLGLILTGSSSYAAAVGGFPLPSHAFGGDKEKKQPKLTTAKDVYGTDLKAGDFLASRDAGDRTMVQGLKGDPTYIIVDVDPSDSNTKTLKNYALNAECTHLGCVVPYSEFERKFVCPCHGSQYDVNGLVIRGPAPNPLALAHVSLGEEENGDKIVFTPWTEEDFRTNEKAWWT